MTCHLFGSHPQLAIKMLELGADPNSLDGDGLSFLDHIMTLFDDQRQGAIALMILIRYNFDWRLLLTR